jgi:hypothetical protein
MAGEGEESEAIILNEATEWVDNDRTKEVKLFERN